PDVLCRLELKAREMKFPFVTRQHRLQCEFLRRNQRMCSAKGVEYRFHRHVAPWKAPRLGDNTKIVDQLRSSTPRPARQQLAVTSHQPDALSETGPIQRVPLSDV